jgi:hypothetical protein
MGAHDGEGRYRINKRVALPKFISPRNPFAPAANAESSAKRGGEGTAVATAKVGPGEVGKAALQVAIHARAARWIGEWTRKINPLPRLQKPPGPAKSAVPRFPQSPIQSELSLDNVRVVRNDLSDADFEVVTKKTPVVGPLVSPSLPLQAGLEPAGSAWDRLTTRFFGERST